LSVPAATIPIFPPRLRSPERWSSTPRGVFRVYRTRVAEEAWEWWRDAAGFSQGFVGRFTDAGDTIVGQSQLCEEDVNWMEDLAITYRREK
jgi:hypothetical protein